MIFKFLKGSLRLNPQRQILILLSVALGAAIAASLGSVTIQLEDQLARGLRKFGANIIVEPERSAAPTEDGSAQFLKTSAVSRVLTIFWRYNITALSPALTFPAIVTSSTGEENIIISGVWFERRVIRPGQKEKLPAGILNLFPYWKLDGRYPDDNEAGAVIGRALAERLGKKIGDKLETMVNGVIVPLQVVGLLSSGGYEDDQILINLEQAQEISGLDESISRILLSVITIPLDDFGRMNPEKMTREQLDKWICSAYITSVVYDIEKTIPGSAARPLWDIAEAESMVLSRLGTLMTLLAAISLIAAGLSASSSFAARILGRGAEIGLMRAIGASKADVILLISAETGAIALIGGALGVLLSAPMLAILGRMVFGVTLRLTISAALLSFGGAFIVAALGSIWPIRLALRIDPAVELKGAK